MWLTVDGIDGIWDLCDCDGTVDSGITGGPTAKSGGAPAPETPTVARKCGDIFTVCGTRVDPGEGIVGIFIGKSIRVGAGAIGTIRGTADAELIAELITDGNSAASASPALIAIEGSPQGAQCVGTGGE